MSNRIITAEQELPISELDTLRAQLEINAKKLLGLTIELKEAKINERGK